MFDQTHRELPESHPASPAGEDRTVEEYRDPWLGATLADRYVIEARLGAGGMGVVHRGCQISVKRAVAIKILPASLSDDWERVRRFMPEARLTSSLSHPNTVTLHDFGQSAGGSLFLVMEWVEGVTLESHLGAVGRLETSRAVAIVVQLLDALEDAHGRGIIHRDLKPANIMLSPGAGRPDFVKMLDFGLARGGEDGTGETTRSGAVMGTPAYMSPEQGRGRVCDLRTDLYSVGVILFEMLTGGRPFTGTTHLAVLLEHFHEPPPRLADRCLALEANEAREAVLARALAKPREERFATATQIRAALLAAARLWPESTLAAKEPSQPVVTAKSARAARERSVPLRWVAAAACGLCAAWLGWHSALLPAPSAAAPVQDLRGTRDRMHDLLTEP